MSGEGIIRSRTTQRVGPTYPLAFGERMQEANRMSRLLAVLDKHDSVLSTAPLAGKDFWLLSSALIGDADR